MTAESIHIDPYLFEKHLVAFRKFVEEKTGVPFVSFAAHPYTEKHEGYKYEVHRAAREALAFQTWSKFDIGSGQIIEATIAAIEIPESNLVQWQARYGEEARPHQPLYKAQNDPKKRKRIESCIYKLYHTSSETKTFDELVAIFGKKYPLIAYLLFLKDRSKYLPIAPTFLDRSFKLLGVDFKTAHRCSWENYSTYINLIGEIKSMLTEGLSIEVSMLDAHSFAWMLSAQMTKEDKLPDVHKYLKLESTEREAIVKARVGQGQFRDRLIDYWANCAVTGCSESDLLRASHIKPWAESDLSERLSLYNGLLLSPTLDLCFDKGYVSFDESGQIMISSRFSNEDLQALGISQDMKLDKYEPEHMKYLSYHRQHIYIA